MILTCIFTFVSNVVRNSINSINFSLFHRITCHLSPTKVLKNVWDACHSRCLTWYHFTIQASNLKLKQTYGRRHLLTQWIDLEDLYDGYTIYTLFKAFGEIHMCLLKWVNGRRWWTRARPSRCAVLEAGCSQPAWDLVDPEKSEKKHQDHLCCWHLFHLEVESVNNHLVSSVTSQELSPNLQHMKANSSRSVLTKSNTNKRIKHTLISFLARVFDVGRKFGKYIYSCCVWFWMLCCQLWISKKKHMKVSKKERRLMRA